MVIKLLSSWNRASWYANPRVLWSVFLISILPFFLIGNYYIYVDRKLTTLEQDVMRLEKKTKPLMQMKKQREKIIEELSIMESGYIQKHLEPLTLLETDIATLTKIHRNNDYKPIADRLAFLTSDANKMRFRKIATRRMGMIEETAWVLDHPVEINILDFQKIVFAIGNAKARLAIRKCNLTKKNHLYTLDLELLERTLYEEI